MSTNPTRSGRTRFGWPTKTAFASAVLALSCVAGCNQQDQQAQDLVRKALQQQKAGDTADAVKSLNRSIALDDDLAEAFYLRGSCYAALGNDAEALRDLKKTSSLRPDWDRSWWALGTLHRSLNQNDQAVTCLKQSVSLNPDALDARYDLACLLLKMGDADAAKIHLDQCRKQNPDDVKALMKIAAIEMDENPAKAAMTLSHVLTIDRSNAHAWTQRALAQERSQDIPRALADFTVACRLQPKSAQAWYHRGRLLTELDRHDEAISSLKKANELEPDDLQIRDQLQVARNSFKSAQSAVAKSTAPSKLPVESSFEVPTIVEDTASKAKQESGDFALFPIDVDTADAGQSEAATPFTEVDKPLEEPNSAFAAFPGLEEPADNVIAEAEAAVKSQTPSFDFPAFDEAPAKSDSVSETATAMIAESTQPFDGLQIPTEMLSQVQTPQSKQMTEAEDEVAAATKVEEVSPFAEFIPKPSATVDAVVQQEPAPQFLDLTDGPIDVSIDAGKDAVENGDAAVVKIDDLNPSQTQAPQFTVDQLDSLYQQALAAYRRSDIETAEAKLTTLMQHAPEHRGGRLRLASILEEQGQLEAALGHCNQLLNDFGLSMNTVMLKGRIQEKLGQPENALQTYSAIIASDIPSARALSKRADLLVELKQPEAAIRDLSELIDSKTELVSSLERRAIVFESQQKWGLAVADWTSIGRIDSSNLNALERRADAFAQMGETNPAIADLKTLLSLKPGRLDVLRKLCDLNASIGDWEQVYTLTSRAVDAENESDEILFLKATAASQLGRTDEAISALSAALKQNPDHQPSRVRRAELLLNQQNFEASLADWNQAIDTHGKTANLLAGRASALAALGEMDQAFADFDQAILIEPNNISARRGRGQLFQKIGDLNAAIGDAGELLRLRPAEPEGLAITANSLFQQQKFEAAAVAFEKAIASNPTNADFIWKRAQCRLRLKQHELAVQDLDRLLTINPAHKEALKERSNLKEEAGSYASAVEDLDALLKLDAKNSEALLQRGILNHRLARFDAAVADLTSALDLKPQLHSAKYRRGLALQQLNQPGRALADLEAAIEADANNADYLYSRGNLFASQSINGRAIEDYAQAVAIRPSHAAAWYNYGNMLFPAGKIEQAIGCWNKAIDIQPDLFRAYNNRAAAYVQLKEYEKAVSDYQRTLELNPSYAHAYDNFAWLLATADDASVRDPQKAITLARKACDLTENRDWAYLSTLAAAHAETGNFDKAREILVKSHELAPSTQKDRLIRLVKTYESELQRGTARKAQKRPGSSIRL